MASMAGSKGGLRKEFLKKRLLQLNYAQNTKDLLKKIKLAKKEVS